MVGGSAAWRLTVPTALCAPVPGSAAILGSWVYRVPCRSLVANARAHGPGDSWEALYLGATEEQPAVWGQRRVGRRRGGFLADVKCGRARGGQSEAPLMVLGTLGPAKCPRL